MILAKDEKCEVNSKQNSLKTPDKTYQNNKENNNYFDNESINSSKNKKKDHLDKLTPNRLEIKQKYDKNIDEMPFSPLSSNNGFSNSTIKIKCGESENDSEIKFTYSKSKFSDNVGTPTFTDKRSPTIHKKEDIYNTPKVEQERGEANSAEPKSILNSDYVVTGRKLAQSSKISSNQTPILRLSPAPITSEDLTNKESLNSEFLQDSEASQNQAKNTASYVENSDHLPRKKIYYNDSSLKTGGGGTGLMYGASDNSSSSSKKVEKKGSVSSNSAHSVNSNSEKSSQKQFDRLIERNKILDLYYFNNDQTDSENIQGISTPIKLLNNGEIKNYINEGQESYFENKNSDLEQSNVNYYQFEVSNSNLNRQSSNQNKSSEEKRLSKDQVDLTNDIIYYKKSFSENKSEANNLISDKSPAIFYKTPDKIIEFHVTSPESNKESEKDSPYYSGSSNITPNKHLETITEQPTNMEMDNTD